MACKKIAIITARSGSKGLPNKNILMLLNKPLIAYTIEAAIKSKCFERVIVSTDSLEYKEISEKYGAEVILRDESLASDTATSFMVVEDIIKKTEDVDYDYFVLLQPTSPFRTENHIRESVELFENNSKKVDFLVSVCKSDKSSSVIKVIEEDLLLKNYDLDYSNYRRQNGVEYVPNGAIFIGKTKEYLKNRHFFGNKSIAYIMSKKDSIDIDDKLDFELAILIANQNNKKKNLLDNIKKRIEEKKDLFSLKRDITLVGHSIFDYWKIDSLNNKTVNNLGVAGISTKEYLDFIVKSNLISQVGNEVIIFAGTNDVVIEGWKVQDTLKWVEEIIEFLKSLNPQVKIYLIEIPKVISRLDRSNTVIIEANEYLKKNISKEIGFIKLGKDFDDKFGNLKLEYTYDGLHFNGNGYKVLKKIIERNI